MRLAVVIPAHDAADVVATAVASALAVPEVAEVVVVDDGSVDGTADAARAAGGDRTRVVGQPRQGPGPARNAGAAITSAPFLVFLDADDELLPEAGEVFAAGDGAALVRTGAEMVHPDHVEVVMAEAHPAPFPRGCPLAGSFAVARDLFDRVGGYDGRYGYGENSELLLRVTAAATAAGRTVAVVPRPTVRCRRRPHSELTARYRSRRLDAVERLLVDHRDLLAADPPTRTDHLALAARLQADAGHPARAVTRALRSALSAPRSARAWGRVPAVAVAGTRAALARGRSG